MWLAPAGAQDVPYVPYVPLPLRGLSLGCALREGELPKGREAMQVRGLSLACALREGWFPKGHETMQALGKGGRVTRALTRGGEATRVSACPRGREATRVSACPKGREATRALTTGLQARERGSWVDFLGADHPQPQVPQRRESLAGWFPACPPLQSRKVLVELACPVARLPAHPL
jgi:hypothetical protein